MTSNVGARDIKDISSFGFSGSEKKDQYSSMKNTVEDALKKLFSPEFLNRVDEAIVFRSLEKEDILKIIDIEIKDLMKNIKENKMTLVLDNTARNFVADKGFDHKFGARPLRRAIQQFIEDPLAEEILRGTFKEGAQILAKHFEATDHLVFIEEELDQNVSDKAEETTEG
jgi:ATP-dependent Clp protease ATP-binding subunit ClpC